MPSLALVILDGFGLAPDGPGNAISQANTPVFDELWAAYPHTTLSTSGRDVGLPDGQMGNSEVGHLNLGAGAVVKQDLARIDDSIADGSFFENPALRAACGSARESRRGRLHAIGLISDGGVHSGWEHIEAIIELAGEEGVTDLVLHALTDGRDTLPHNGAGYVEEVERWLRHTGRIGTVGGRYWGMDRDRRWDRTKRAYDAIVHAEGPRAEEAVEAVRDSYERDVTDEFIEPVVIGDYDGAQADEPFIFINFRPDRARQMTRALGEPDFDEFDRGGAAPFEVTTMTEYHHGWPYPVAFPPKEPETTIAQVIAEQGERQLHVAETEKYAHVTYFFNGGREEEWPGEERFLADSPRDVPTYDHKPEMSAAARGPTVHRALERRRLPLRDHQLRQPGHGRPHRRDPGRGRRVRGGGPPSRRGRRRGPREGRRADHHRRPRQLRADARARRLAEHRPLDQPGARDRHGAGDRAARRRHPRRRRPDRARPARHPAARGDDRRRSLRSIP